MWGDPEIPDEAGGDDDDDDDVNIMEEPGTMHPSILPRPPVYDDDHNPFITIVDVSGIHHLPVCGCICEAADPHIDIAYLEVGLFPASFIRIQTVFTMDVLKDYRLANLECKTSAYQYYQKLRRLTCPAFPKAVLNRYRELRRLSREYRNIKLWKMHGRGHDMPDGHRSNADAGPEIQDPAGMDIDGLEPTEGIPPGAEDDIRGKLASFCPACPQPGINLPADWKDDPQRYI